MSAWVAFDSEDNIRDMCSSLLAVLGTCATFSTAAPLRHWRELKKVGHVAVELKQKIMAGWQWCEHKMVLIRAISAPFSSQILLRNLDKLLPF